ncbi:MAG: hypothetical protein K1X28_10225 [Parachlamydiales bacterium]|nr:hypothetical protein [Parachlamydiales bacterium]
MSQGILIASDQNQEWLLPWWWRHYSASNDYPVAFVDFGMSPEMKAWCLERGELIPFTLKMPRILKSSVSLDQQIIWENHYGKKIWQRRKIWFKKPFAFQLSPFAFSIWLDLDTQVNKNLEPLFNSLLFFDIALKRDSEEIQWLHRERGYIDSNEVNYDCGVVAFRKEAPILLHWIEEIEERNSEYVFDQQALSKALAKHALFELPELANWSAAKGINPDALIVHYHGGYLKEWIKQQEMQHSPA